MRKYLVVTITLLIALICGGNVTASVVLDGTSYLYIPDSEQNGLDITEDLTLEIWVKLNSLPASNDTVGLINKYTGGSNRSYLFRLYNNAGTQQLYFSNSSDGSSIVTSASVTWSPSTAIWHHIALVYDASTGSATFYVDGSQQGITQTGLATSIFNSSAPLDIGCLKNSSDTAFKFFNGSIAEVRIWNVARTAAEIASDYNQTLSGNENGLVSYWKLNSNLQSSAVVNTLTASGTVTYSDNNPFSTEETNTEETTTETTTVTCTCTAELVLSKSATGLLVGDATPSMVQFMDLGYNSDGVYNLCVSNIAGTTLSSTSILEMTGYTAMAMTQTSSTSVVIAAYSGTTRAIFNINYSGDTPIISSTTISN